MTVNEHYLKGIQCPQCAHVGSFVIETTECWLVLDNDLEPISDSPEWNAGSYIRCNKCGHESVVKDFSNNKVTE